MSMGYGAGVMPEKVRLRGFARRKRRELIARDLQMSEKVLDVEVAADCLIPMGITSAFFPPAAPRALADLITRRRERRGQVPRHASNAGRLCRQVVPEGHRRAEGRQIRRRDRSRYDQGHGPQDGRGAHGRCRPR